MKTAYGLWHDHHRTLPKVERHSLGQRIDALFIEAIEMVATAGFLPPQEKMPYVRVAIRKMDTLKILLMILWEMKSLDTQKYAALSVKLDEIGRRLGGWVGQLRKQNSLPATSAKRCRPP